MKVWLYYRLSRDEDEELNSLNNQRKIIYNFAVSNGHEVVGESFDDNVSGMHFNREGIEKIYEVVEAGKIEAIIVKDLSRLGRHRTQTALFIDYLREHDVRVLSATENIDTFNENDDLIIGFKGLVNDFYAKGLTKGDLEQLLLLLSPFVPHIVEEMWEQLGFAAKYGKMAMQMPWPVYDAAKTVDATVEMAVQVNGKLRGTIVMPTDSEEAAVVAAAMENERVKKAVEGMNVVKTILVKNKLVNLIVKPAK